MKSAGIVAAIVLVGIAFYWYQQGDADATSNEDSGSAGDDFYTSWANAVAIAENVNPDYNNPGGLDEQGDLGSTPATGGGVIGIFSTYQKGFAALVSTLQSTFNKYSGDTLLQATANYILGPIGAAKYSAGNYPANVVNEAQTIATNLGVSVDDTLSSISGRY